MLYFLFPTESLSISPSVASLEYSFDVYRQVKTSSDVITTVIIDCATCPLEQVSRCNGNGNGKASLARATMATTALWPVLATIGFGSSMAEAKAMWSACRWRD